MDKPSSVNTHQSDWSIPMALKIWWKTNMGLGESGITQLKSYAHFQKRSGRIQHVNRKWKINIKIVFFIEKELNHI